MAQDLGQYGPPCAPYVTAVETVPGIGSALTLVETYCPRYHNNCVRECLLHQSGMVAAYGRQCTSTPSRGGEFCRNAQILTYSPMPMVS
jgi:hypothetical protein